jgi:hypothetical protein
MAALDLDSKTSLENECEPSHIVNLRGSLKPISSVKWKKDSWMSHLYGTILKPSHTDRFTDWWTSLLQDTLASRSLPQEKEQEKKTPATSGLGSQTEFDFFDPECASLKTSKDISVLDSERSLENWNQWVTKCRGEYSLRVKLAHLTSASGSSSWPTASVMDTTGGSYKTEWKDGRAVSYHNHTQENPVAYGAKLADAVKYGPVDPVNSNTHGNRQESRRTPSSSDGEGGIMEMREGCAGKYKLRDHVAAEEKKSWATPNCADHMTGGFTKEGKIAGYQMDLRRSVNTPTAKLNPRWVETLMGLPIGWTMPSCIRPMTIELTNCDSLETELCQQQQNEHSEFLKENK